MEEEKREHDAKMKKMEAEMEQVFEMKVKEKKQKLKDSESELTRRHEERKKVTFTAKTKPSKFETSLKIKFIFFRLLNFKFVNWKNVVKHLNKKKLIGNIKMELHLKI
jgi:hypothetical protein